MAQLTELDQLLNSWRLGQVAAPPVYFSDNGQMLPLNHYALQIKATQVVLHSTNGATTDQAVGINLLQQAASWVDQFYIGTAYRQVLQHPQWQILYQVAQRPWTKIQGTALVNKNGTTIPCHSCGLVVPLKHITVDHQKPQTGGEFAAILKLFHTLGCNLTHSGPAGGKGNALLLGNIAALGTKSGAADIHHSDGRPERYTLTANGIVFLVWRERRVETSSTIMRCIRW